MGLGMLADVGEEEVERFDFGVAGAWGEELTRTLDQVVRVAPRPAQGRSVGGDALFADEAVRVQAAVKRSDLHVEVLRGQQADGFFGGGRARGVGIEVDEDAFGEAGDLAHLHFREGRAGDGKHVVDAGHVHGDAVHLAFDEDDEVVLAHLRLGLVEIEQHLALGIERRSRASSGT